MTIIRIKGFKIFEDRHKILRCYHRKTGVPIDLKKAPLGSAEFIAECSRIAKLAEAKAVEKEKPGTLGALICDYRKSTVFQDLAPRTRIDYQKVFDYLRPIADTPLKAFNRPLVVRIRDKAAASKGRRFANYAKAVHSIVFGWGRERGAIGVTPRLALKISGAKRAPRKQTGLGAIKNATPSWTRRQTICGRLIAVMMFTGLGPKDALTLPRNFVRAGEIATRRGQDRRAGFLAHAAPLAAILDTAPASYCGDALRQFQGPPMVAERP